MDFAKNQLEKWGWSEGKGLGKNEQGISTALKPKLKFDNTGLGHDVGNQFTNNWWEKVFNSAAQNLNVELDHKKEIKVKVKDKDAVEISTKNYSVKHLKKNTSLEYGSFIKTAKLTETGIENFGVQPFSSANGFEPIRTLTDEELFAACGGRTAHKGARHGLKLSGKLARIEKQEKMQQQEKMLLKKMRKVSLSDQDDVQIGDIDKKLKKLRKHHTDSVDGKYTAFSEDLELPSTSGISPLKKKKNKKKKRVSFNENVTKIYMPDLDTSFESEVGSCRDENSNDAQLNNEGSDEGIEKDLENNNNDLEDNHRAFEIARLSFSDLSKEERKKLKKKRKMAAKLNNATGMFLQSVNENSNEEMIMDDDKDTTSKKRKHYDDDDCLSKRSLTEFPERTKKLKEKRKKNKDKRKEKKKHEKMLEKQQNNKMNEIVQSLDSVCRISESE